MAINTTYNAIKTGKSSTVGLSIQTSASKGAETVQVDRKLAAKLIEAQRRMTDENGNRVVGGKGITTAEMKGLFTSVRDAGNNDGKARYVSSGESALLKMLDGARDDRFAVQVNLKNGPVAINLVGFSGKTSGAEGEFVDQRKALAADIARKNLFGTPVPSKAE